MLTTGRYLAVSGVVSRLMPQALTVIVVIAVVSALWMLHWLPLVIGLALALSLLCATPSAEDHLARTLRRRPDLSVLTRLAAEADLQRSVFDVAGELVGCVRVSDCSRHFANALRTYWRFSSCECWIWERGTWTRLSTATIMDEDQDPQHYDSPPTIVAPVVLPGNMDHSLLLDLSPAVSGQAVLVLQDARPQPTLEGHQQRDVLALAEVLRAQLALALRRAILYRDLKSLARIDPLTGTDRRWYGEQRLHEILAEQGSTIAVAMVDIDHFKSINDQFGHLVGDQVLSHVGGLLRQQLRPSDMVFRFGGEEFVVVLQAVDRPAAQAVGERILSAIAEEGGGPPVTVSIGFTVGQQGESPRSALDRADRACYQAKAGGRNQIHWV